ncbi:MAG: hypothetical protein IID44_26880 [Planctomycetes bacterium]|nr:hypothetical protein [Planctomycetota bacterium]
MPTIIDVKRGPQNQWIVDAPDYPAEKSQNKSATEPRKLSSDAAFGDFNLPLEGSSAVILADEDESDVEYLRDSLEAGEFEPYSEFRQNELGL